MGEVKKPEYLSCKIMKCILLSFLLFCGHVVYEHFKSALPGVYLPVSLKADGAVYEFEYIPPKASLRKQTLRLFIDNDNYLLWREKLNIKNPDHSVGYIFIIQMQIYHKNKKVFDNTYYYKDSHNASSIFLDKEYNYQKIYVRELYSFNEKYRYPNNYFEFRAGEKYKIVLKDLCVNSEISNLKIYLGLDGASDARKYRIYP